MLKLDVEFDYRDNREFLRAATFSNLSRKLVWNLDEDLAKLSRVVL